MIYKKLIGTWKLKKFSNINNGKIIDWTGPCHGHLIYTEYKYVSASINKSTNNLSKDSFYFAKVAIINESTVTHTLLESSISTRIGTTHVRTINWDNNDLVISGKGLTGDIQLTWTREN